MDASSDQTAEDSNLDNEADANMPTDGTNGTVRKRAGERLEADDTNKMEVNGKAKKNADDKNEAEGNENMDDLNGDAGNALNAIDLVLNDIGDEVCSYFFSTLLSMGEYKMVLSAINI